MLKVEKHGNIWMVVRRNSEGTVTVVKSCKSERAALNASKRLPS